MSRSTTAFFRADGQQFIREMQRLNAGTQRFEASTVRGLTNINRNLADVGRNVRNLRTVFYALQATVGTGFLAGFADQAKQIRNSLREAGDTSQETFDKLLKASNDTYSSFADTTSAVQRFQKSLRDTQDIEATIRQVETLNKLLLLGGKSKQERSGTLLQFSQALQSGRLNGEELRSLRENAPVELLEAIAAAAGGTMKSLKDMGAAGELTREVMVTALNSLADYADQRFGDIQVTIGGAATVLANGALVAVEQLDSATGASEALIGILTTLGKGLKDSGEFVTALGGALKIGAAAFAVYASGRGAQAVVAVLGRLAEALGITTSALKANQFAAARAAATATADIMISRDRVIARKAVVASLKAELVTLQADGATTAKVNAAKRKLARAELAAGTAARAHAKNRKVLTAATLAQAEAEMVMGRGARIAAAGGRLLKTAFNFIGGWSGVILGVGAALYALVRHFQDARDYAKQFAEAMNDVRDASSNLGTLSRDIESDEQRLIEAEKKLKQAIEDRDVAAQLAASREISAINARLEGNKELQKIEESRKRSALTKAEDALASDLRGQLGDPRSLSERNTALYGKDSRLRPRGGFSENVVTSAEEIQRQAEGVAKLRSELEALYAKQAEGAALTVADEDRIVVLRQLFERVEQLRVSQAGLSEEASKPIAIDVDPVGDQASKLEQVFADIDKATQKIADLRVARDEVLAQIAQADKDGSATGVDRLKEALAAIDDELQGLGQNVNGSMEAVQALLDQTNHLIDVSLAYEFDDEGKARDKAEKLRSKLEEVLAKGQDLNAQTMAGLVGQLNDAEAAARGLSDELSLAISRANQATNAAQLSVARAKVRANTVGDPIGRATGLFQVDNPLMASHEGRGDARTEAYNRQVSAATELVRLEATLNEQTTKRERALSKASRGGGGSKGGRGGKSQQVKDEEAVLKIVKEMATEEEKRAIKMKELIDLRARLLGHYNEEDVIIQKLDESMERLANKSQLWTRDLARGILEAVGAGKDLGDILGLVRDRLVQMSIDGILDNLFDGGGGQKKKSGGGIWGAIGGLFGFAQGGIMTNSGPLPLQAYAGGGIANSPQVAVFGEGSTPEAFVPLPDGRSIPVKFPDLDALRKATRGVKQVVQTIAPVTNIEINGTGLSKEELQPLLASELNARDARLMVAVREANEDDPNYLG